MKGECPLVVIALFLVQREDCLAFAWPFAQTRTIDQKNETNQLPEGRGEKEKVPSIYKTHEGISASQRRTEQRYMMRYKCCTMTCASAIRIVGNNSNTLDY